MSYTRGKHYIMDMFFSELCVFSVVFDKCLFLRFISKDVVARKSARSRATHLLQ